MKVAPAGSAAAPLPVGQGFRSALSKAIQKAESAGTDWLSAWERQKPGGGAEAGRSPGPTGQRSRNQGEERAS